LCWVVEFVILLLCWKQWLRYEVCIKILSRILVHEKSSFMCSCCLQVI
jgi:hypothetical protein